MPELEFEQSKSETSYLNMFVKFHATIKTKIKAGMNFFIFEGWF